MTYLTWNFNCGFFQTELSEIENKVNSARDTVEVQMHTFLSREAEIGKILLKYFELKREYHRQAAERLANEESKFRQLLESAISPVFGAELEPHLNRTGAKIALPIRSCVCRLLQLDVCEEGLFRVAAPTLKIKRLASLMDTEDCSDEQVTFELLLKLNLMRVTNDNAVIAW